MPKKITTEQFIANARKVHGDKYDYSKVNYKHITSKVRIICPEHGEFEQTPDAHLRTQNCPKCSGRYMDTKFFKEKASRIHGDRYDYSKVEFLNNKTKVIIICKDHGEFQQNPTPHLRGANCPKCVGGVSITHKEFMEKLYEVHGDRYDYSKVNYVNNLTPIIIICKDHGEFQMKPAKHLNSKQNCPKCRGQNITYMLYGEARTLVRKLNLKSESEYHKWYEENRVYCQNIGLPKYPQAVYNKDK